MVAYLNAQSVTSAKAVGKVVLTAHSGGYGGCGGSLAIGGVDTITDVILFDSAYGYFDAFAAWANASASHHFLSLFTNDTAYGIPSSWPRCRRPARIPTCSTRVR